MKIQRGTGLIRSLRTLVGLWILGETFTYAESEALLAAATELEAAVVYMDSYLGRLREYPYSNSRVIVTVEDWQKRIARAAAKARGIGQHVIVEIHQGGRR